MDGNEAVSSDTDWLKKCTKIKVQSLTLTGRLRENREETVAEINDDLGLTREAALRRAKME